MTKKTITYLSIIIIVIGSIFLANGLILAWTAPTESPPDGNVDAPLTSESDPQVGSLGTSGKWCTTDGSAVNCTADAPSFTNTDYCSDGSCDGDLAVSGDLTVSGRDIYLGSQRLYGDNSSALYWDGNHDTVTQMIFRDKQDTTYGRVYGSGDGANFGLLDGDGNWSYLAVKDNYTQFRINNTSRMLLNSSGYLWTDGCQYNYGTCQYAKGMSTHVMNTQHWYPLNNVSSQIMYVGINNPVNIRGYVYDSGGAFHVADSMQVDSSLSVSNTITANDVFGAGGKNLIIGDDTYLTDVDVANTLGIYGNQNPKTATIRLGSGGGYGHATIRGSATGILYLEAPSVYVPSALFVDYLWFNSDEMNRAGYGDIYLGYRGTRTTYVYNAYHVSDERLKQDIVTIPNVLDRVTELRGVNFRWKKDTEELNMGLIAQEVEEIFPELVSTSDKDGYKSIDYEGFTGALVEAIKELKTEKDAEIDQLKTQINQLKIQNDALQEVICQLKPDAEICD